MPPEYEALIDHPVHPGWLTHGRDIYDDAGHIEAITRRFEASGEDVPRLLSSIALAATITDAERMRHESQSRGELRLYGSSKLEQYSDMAGRPKRVGEFIDWFSTIAQECFDHAETRADLNEIGLDLGGMRQAGDRGGTKPIDAMAETIPELLSVANPAATIEIVTRGKAINLSYKAAPLDHYPGGRYNPNFSYAYLTRKRSAANISLPGRFPLRVWKVSHALVAINQLDDAEVAVIHESFADPANLTRNALKNSSPAGVMGRTFEKAIQPREREKSRAFVPLSTHYYVTMNRPETVESNNFIQYIEAQH